MEITRQVVIEDLYKTFTQAPFTWVAVSRSVRSVCHALYVHELCTELARLGILNQGFDRKTNRTVWYFDPTKIQHHGNETQ